VEATDVVPVKYSRGMSPASRANLKPRPAGPPFVSSNAAEMQRRSVIKRNANKMKIMELLRTLVLTEDRDDAKLYLDVMRKHPFLSAYVGVLEHEDPRVRAEWAEKILDRILGKPKQQTEITGADSGPLWMQIQAVALNSGPDPI
jgi:hypothetical protein